MCAIEIRRNMKTQLKLYKSVHGCWRRSGVFKTVGNMNYETTARKNMGLLAACLARDETEY